MLIRRCWSRAQCIQCYVKIKFSKKSRTNCKNHAMMHKAKWKEFEEKKAKSVAFKNTQCHLFPVGGQLALASGLLPRNHEENTKLRKLLAHSIGCSVTSCHKFSATSFPRLSLPSKNTIQKDINLFADEHFLKNKSILTTALAYSLGVDGWSYNRRQCLALSCFEFLEDGSSKRLPIDFIEVEDQKADTVREACRIVCTVQPRLSEL